MLLDGSISMNTQRMYTNMLLLIIISTLVWALGAVLRNPFRYPYFIHGFDVSGKRNPKIDDLLDEWLIGGGLLDVKDHHRKVLEWQMTCEKRISKSIFRGYRQRQYNRVNDAEYENHGLCPWYQKGYAYAEKNKKKPWQ